MLFRGVEGALFFLFVLCIRPWFILSHSVSCFCADWFCMLRLDHDIVWSCGVGCWVLLLMFWFSVGVMLGGMCVLLGIFPLFWLGLCWLVTLCSCLFVKVWFWG